MAAHHLIGAPLFNNLAGVSGKGYGFNTGWQINTLTKGHRSPHGPRPISIICHLPDPHSFLLPTTFNYLFEQYIIKIMRSFWSCPSSLSNIICTKFFTQLQRGKYNEKCDVYSWGITLWEMISRKKPFEGKSKRKLLFQRSSVPC